MKEVFLSLFVLVFSCVNTNAGNLTIDEYKFTWNVLDQKKVELSVVKTDETSYIKLSQSGPSYRSLEMTPKGAEELTSILSKTTSFYKKQKGSPVEVSEVEKSAHFTVAFKTTKKYGFSIIIKKNDEKFSFDILVLDKASVKALLPHLAKAHNMIDLVNQKINP